MMGILDIFRSAPARAKIEPQIGAPPGVQASGSLASESQWNGFVTGRVSRAGVVVNERTTMSLPAVMQALRIICGVFAMTPLAYYRRTAEGRERASDDPLWTLLHDRPNQTQSAFAFKELLLADVLLTGNFYAYVSRDSRMRPVALTRIKPGNVTVHDYFDRAGGLELFYDATLPDKSHERFSARDIWHIAGPTRDGEVGLSPLDYMRDALGGSIATSDYTSRYWANNARPPIQLQTDHKMAPEDKARLRADWKARFAGVDGDSIAVLDQGLKADFLTFDHQQSQLLETRQFQVLDVARAFGVPPHLLFDLSRATFSNIEHQSLEFITFHMGPHYERVAGAAARQFAAPDHYFEFLTDALVKGDIKTRWEAYRIQRETGVLSADEIRERENLNRIGGAAGDERWRPGNMTISGTPVAQPAPISAVPAN
jgi:HK97 family phage portal protein